MSKNSLISLAGMVWGLAGIFLLFRGVQLFGLALTEQGASREVMIFSGFLGLAFGGFKGKFILTRTARKNLGRIENLEGGLKPYHVFSPLFYGFIALMISLGVLLRMLNQYLGGYVVVAAIYCGIGLALLVGSTAYWAGRAKPVPEEAD